MKFSRLLLIPISFLYGLGISLRNIGFDLGILPSRSFSLPTITIGNLSVGGTGKTPHTEYLVRLLNKELEVAVLSRGYGRQTKGYLLSSSDSLASAIGDEPRQIKQKFPDLTVAVDEKRVHGITKLMEDFPSLNAVLLDDAFQHRSLIPGLSILLTPYYNLYPTDILLPTGTLREWASGSNRADIIIVTKTPANFSILENRAIIDQLKPKPHQKVFFSYFEYGDLVPVEPEANPPISLADLKSSQPDVLLVTGIAYPENMVTFLESSTSSIKHQKFPDHHIFKESDVQNVQKIFDNIASEQKLIILTEKDAMRLAGTPAAVILKGLPVYYLPIQVAFHGKDKDEFNEQILDYVRRNQAHHGIHQGKN